MKRTVLAALLLAGSALAAPMGSLAYIRNATAWIEPRVGAAPQALPRRGAVTHLALSPVTGMLAVFEDVNGRNSPETPPQRAFVFDVPYTKATPLPGPWTSARPQWLVWRDDGRTLRAWAEDRDELSWRAPGANAKLPPYGSASRDGRVLAWPADDGAFFSTSTAGKRPLYTTSRFSILLDALRAQAKHRDVADFLKDHEPALAKSWNVPTPAVSPDGEAIYFASNLGRGDDDLRNNWTFFLFKAEAKTGRTIALGQLGAFHGQAPSLSVSPDGKKLLVRQSGYVSAFQQPTELTVFDLVTGARLELTQFDPEGRGDLTRVNRACWLADSEHVAYGATYFRSDEEARADVVDAARSLVVVRNIRDGRAVRTIRGAFDPGCGPK